MDTTIGCECGNFRGKLSDFTPSRARRILCYCNDCQDFLKEIGAETYLDAKGGSDIVQLTPSQIRVEAGADQIRCLRLTPKGLFRWFTACCNTPIANTGPAGLPFAGVYSALVNEGLEKLSVQYRIQTHAATGSVQGARSYRKLPVPLIPKIALELLVGKLKGRDKPSPFYGGNGAPVCQPRIVRAS